MFNRLLTACAGIARRAGTDVPHRRTDLNYPYLLRNLSITRSNHV